MVFETLGEGWMIRRCQWERRRADVVKLRESVEKAEDKFLDGEGDYYPERYWILSLKIQREISYERSRGLATLESFQPVEFPTPRSPLMIEKDPFPEFRQHRGDYQPTSFAFLPVVPVSEFLSCLSLRSTT